MCMCVCECTVCFVNRIFSGFDNEKPLIFPWHKDSCKMRMSSQLLPTSSLNAALFISAVHCLCVCSKGPWCSKNHKMLGPRFLLSAIMSQSKLKPNHKLVPSQIQLTDSRSLCFFEKPLMLAGGFCTHSDGNEWYFKRFFFIRQA